MKTQRCSTACHESFGCKIMNHITHVSQNGKVELNKPGFSEEYCQTSRAHSILNARRRDKRSIL